MKTVYLSGPIMDEHEGHARAWREEAKGDLKNHFLLLDPMRRNFKDREVDSANEIVEFDLQDVRDADILLVNYNKPSIGTSMEVFYAAHELGKNPAELRRQNFIAPDAFPYQTPVALLYDSGNYAATLDKALAAADIGGFDARRAASEAAGKKRGDHSVKRLSQNKPSGRPHQSLRHRLNASK